MAISTNSQFHETGSIRSETNVAGQWLDAEDANAMLAHQAHSAKDTVSPWSQSYEPEPEPIYVEPSAPVEPDPALEAAQRKDLRIRNIRPN